MSDRIVSTGSEPLLRVVCFLAVLICMGAWETLSPRRQAKVSRRKRWLFHVGLAAFNTAFMRICLPLTAVAAASVSDERRWGLFGLLPLPWWIEVPASVLMLDLIIYLQHMMFHAIPWLWRIHRFHHSDFNLDVTTALRFHSLEMLLSACVKIAAVLLLGCSPISVVVFEILLNAMSMFNHSNVKIASRIERLLRKLVVTPDLHRVHHSVDRLEQNRNFGFNLVWWDRLFRTYQSESSCQDEVRIGLATAADERSS